MKSENKMIRREIGETKLSIDKTAKALNFERVDRLL